VRRQDEWRIPVEAIRLAARGVDDVLASAATSAASAAATSGTRSATVDARRVARGTTGGRTRELHARTGARTNADRLTCVQVVALGVAVLRFAEDEVRVLDVDARVETVSAADAEPVHVGDAAPPALGARAAPTVVVLQARVDVIRMLIVGGHDIGETGRHRGDEVPGLALIVADVQATVVADHQMLAIVRIDPDRVLIDVRR
jgi:hypothetical protein